MIDLEHCTILGSEPIDSNSLNRCIFNLFTKMGEFNSNFLNATSENVPQSPFFSGGYDNALTDIPYIAAKNVHKATREEEGVVPRLYKGDVNIDSSTDNSSFITDSVTGTYTYTMNQLSGFAPTVDSLFRDDTPLVLKSVIDEEVSLTTATSSIGYITSPTIKHTAYMIAEKTGVSFGTINFKRFNGDVQNNEFQININLDLIGLDGVDEIRFFTIGNGISTGVNSVSENLDMVTNANSCSVTYLTDSDIIISNVTKNDDGDTIVVDNATGRILDKGESYDYTKCTILNNDTYSLPFFIIFSMKENILKYTDDLWCFYIVPSKEYGRDILYSADRWAENYYKYSFANFEAADDGKNLDDGTHYVWGKDGSDEGGCTTIATDAFNGCYNATFQSLCWFSPRLRYADRMFKRCSHATFDNLPTQLKFDSIRNARNMFYGCKSATFGSVEEISLKTASKVEGMFSNCDNATFDSLKKLVLNGDSRRMFTEDYRATFNSLESIEGSATSFVSMFEGCDNAEFPVLEKIYSAKNNAYINATKMFYSLAKPTFDRITEIGFDTASGYDGTSMFEGCYNSEFTNLTSIGNVKYGNRMFMNLDRAGEIERYGKATFENLKSLGSKLENGTEMFCNDKYLNMRISDSASENLPLSVGNSMFKNTSSVVFEGNLNYLTDAEYMFSYTMTAVVEGNMNSLVDGSYMFTNCCSADVSGTMDNLANMYSMFLSTDNVHVSEVPSSASDMQSTFACISGECLVNEWKKSEVDRYCNSTFENSDNVWINGNIIDGNIVDTENMFSRNKKHKNNVPYLVLNNPTMDSVTATHKRYFASDNFTNFGLFQNYDPNGSEPLYRNPEIFTFIGSCERSLESISSFAASADVQDSILCFETTNGGETNYYAYSVTKTPTADPDFPNVVKFYFEDIGELPLNSTISISTLNHDGTPLSSYGSLTTSSYDEVVSVTMYKDGDVTTTGENIMTFSSETMPADYDFYEPPRVQTFTDVDTVAMSKTWKDADNMFHNVVQASLLSGYDCMLSDSLETVVGMFSLDEYEEGDETFKNTGKLFRKMQRSNIKDMSNMFMNRYICTADVFTDLYTKDLTCNKSFLIPNYVVDAVSAFANCGIDASETPYMRLRIPSTLVGAEHMFDGYHGPNIRMDYEPDEWLYVSDDIRTDMMFNGCKFVNDTPLYYKMSIPSIYLQMFNGSDFNLNNVTELEIRDGHTFAYPYSNERFFFNDDNILGCSSVTFSSLQNDITDWFNSNSTTTTNAINVEGVYYATVVGPKNTDKKNYEIMSADRSSGEWILSMSDRSNFTNEMISEINEATNLTLLDSVTSLSNDYGRMTCMFNPSSMFKYSNSKLGDLLWQKLKNSEYDKAEYNFGSCSGVNYSNVTLGEVSEIDGKELTLAFCGLDKPTFENVTNIGDSSVAAYGAFMYCDNATFENLSAIEFMQYDNQLTFTSRFADSDESMDAIYGNYNNMFRYDINSTFENLEHISFNTKSGKDSVGNDARIWFGTDNSVYFSYVKDGSTIAYRIEVTNNDSKNKGKYTITLYDFYGNKMSDEESNGITYYTDVEWWSNVEFTYELCEIDNTVSVIVIILDKYNHENYFIVDRKSITLSKMHPRNGYAQYDTEHFSVSAFYPQHHFVTDTFHSLDGISYTVLTEQTDEQRFYTVDIRDNNSGTVMKLGSNYAREGESSTDPSLDKMWFSRLCYTSDGINYISLTLFKLPEGETPSNPIKYPTDAVSYRLYSIDGDMYVDEMQLIPGTVSYRYIAEIANKTETILSHKAYCSGMFKNCQSATFENLNTINIPMSGSCAEMFGNCPDASFVEGQLKTLILPTSYTFPSTADYLNYQRLFSGMHTNRLDLRELSTNTTNIYNIGMQLDENEHHLIGERLFDGMKYGDTTTIFDLENDAAFRYQNAIYDVKLDSSIAKMIFDRGECWTVNYYDMFKNVIKSIEVEKVRHEKCIPVGTETKNPVYIPSVPDVGPEFEFNHWKFTRKSDGTTISEVASGVPSFHPVECDMEVYATYTALAGKQIMAHNTVSEEVSSINWHDNVGSDKNIVTSFMSSSGS